MPKKAKKGGGGKGVGRTEEERLMLLQQRAKAEEEEAKKKEEFLTLFLKDKLQREERNSALNRLKLCDGWRFIVRQTKANDLRDDIMVTRRTFSRRLDGLDAAVKRLAREVQEAELQESQVRRLQLQQLERLWMQQDGRVKLLRRRWEDGLLHLRSTFSRERQLMESQARRRREDLEDVSFTVEQLHLALLEDIRRLYGDSINVYETSQLQRIQGIPEVKEELQEQEVQEVQEEVRRLRVEAQQMEAQQVEVQQMEVLVEGTDAFRVRAKKIQVSEDPRPLRGSRSDPQRVQVRPPEGPGQCRPQTPQRVQVPWTQTSFLSQDSTTQLRAALLDTETQQVQAEQDLTEARDQETRRTQQLQDQLTRDHAAARRRLMELSVLNDAAARKLTAFIATGQKVLRVADMCHKLEGEWSLSDLTPAEPGPGPGPGPKEPGPGPGPKEPGPGPKEPGLGPEEQGPGPGQDFGALRRLTDGVTAATLQRAALTSFRERLRRENLQLRLLLQQRLDAMTLSDRELDGRHAALTVVTAPKTNTRPRGDTRHNVIEGVHAAKHSL